MRKKAWIVLAVSVVLAACAWVGWISAASDGSRVEKKDVDAFGNPVVGVKDLESVDSSSSIWDQPLVYSAEALPRNATVADRDAIESLVKRSIELEFQAMVSGNESAVSSIKESYSGIYSNRLGDLDIHRNYIDTNARLLAQDGYIEKERVMTRFELKGLEVTGDSARAIAEEEDYSVRQKVNQDQKTPDSIELKGGRQLEFLLERTDGKWQIVADRWVFLPGYEP
jgi:hypothetical protein